MFQVILFTDAPYPHHRIRGYGVHRIGSEIRKAGYSCLVVDFSSALTFEKYKELIELSVGPETLMVGYSTTWLPYRLPGVDNYSNEIPGHEIGEDNKFNSEKEEKHQWKNENMIAQFGKGQIDEWLLYPKQVNPK